MNDKAQAQIDVSRVVWATPKHPKRPGEVIAQLCDGASVFDIDACRPTRFAAMMTSSAQVAMPERLP